MAILTSNRIAFASLLVVANAALAQAQEINSYEDFQLYCSDAAYQYDVASPYCDDYKPYYQERIQEEIQPQNVNPDVNKIKRRSTRRNDVSGYVGGSLGAFFPIDDIEGLGTLIDFVLGTDDFKNNPDTDLETGFGGSLFAGAKFNTNFATDLEFTLFSGETEIDDTSYAQWGIFLNPRLIFPLSKKDSGIAIYLSPGIGISKGKVSYDLPDSTAEFLGTEEGLDLSLEDDISFAWQVKLGIDLPFEERFKSFVQVRYVNHTGENTIDSVSTELGFAIEF